MPPLSETTTNVIKRDRIAMCAGKGNTGKKEGSKVDGAPYFGWHRETSGAVINEDTGYSKKGAEYSGKEK